LTKDNRLHSIWLFLFGGKVMKVFIEAPLKTCVEGNCFQNIHYGKWTLLNEFHQLPIKIDGNSQKHLHG
jgi:hypothetical protein